MSFMDLSRLGEAFKEPKRAFRFVMAILNGCVYALYYRAFRRNVIIKQPFMAFGKVSIIGPGSVYIDSNCSVYENVFRGLTIVTLSQDAKVEIGKGCILGGLTVRCYGRITIGKGSMTALSLVQDVFFVTALKPEAPEFSWSDKEKMPISINDNVWLGGLSAILGGTEIGNDSVVAAGALCFDNKFGEYCLISGSPAIRGLPIRQILKLKGRV
jgi:acetyltransferase-like isoleucine patch superfamily enzyme